MNGLSAKATLVSPTIGPGHHCFQFWHHKSGKVNDFKVRLLQSGKIIYHHIGDSYNKWIFTAIDFFVQYNEQIAFEATSGSSSIYSEIAVDDVKLSDGKCVADGNVYSLVQSILFSF